MKNKYNNILKATSLLGGVQGLNIVLNLVRTKIVAELIGPSGVGLNGIYNETRELIHTTTNLGLDVSGVRDISQAYERWSESHAASDWEEVKTCVSVMRSWLLLLALFGMMVCMLFAIPLSWLTFDDYDHVWGYVMLSPAVAFSTMTCGELAVLKSLRKLKKLAVVSVVNVALGLVVSVPIFYFCGIDGVLPALVTLFGCIMLSTLAVGYHTMPLSLTYSKERLGRGRTMLTIGINFVVCSILLHVVTVFIISYLNRVSSTHLVGLYNSAYTMTMTYAGTLFAAMEQDYFPRLTGVVHNVRERTETLMRQHKVVQMLVAPMLAAFIVGLPVAVPLLLSDEFVDIVPMAQATAVGLLFRAIYLPHAYLPLAAGHNRMFLFVNAVGALDMLLVIMGYQWGGLLGMGIALSVQNGIDMCLVLVVSRVKYGVRFTLREIAMMVCYFVMLLAVYAACAMLNGWAYWAVGTLLTLAVTAVAYCDYKRGNVLCHE